MWNDGAALGHKTIDDGRKQLVELMRELEADQSVDAAKRTAQKLLTYSTDHLRHEEALLMACGYPHFAQHATSHKELTTRLRSLLLADLVPAKTQRRHDFVAEMLDLMREWALLHVLREDVRARPYVHRLSAQVRA